MNSRGISLPSDKRIEYENMVYVMLLKGATRRGIIEYAKGNGYDRSPWGVSDSTIDKYIAKAKKIMAEEANVNRDAEVGLVLSQYNLLYQKAMADSDIKTALNILKCKAELLGLNAPKQVDSKQSGNITIVFDEKFDGIL